MYSLPSLLSHQALCALLARQAVSVLMLFPNTDDTDYLNHSELERYKAKLNLKVCSSSRQQLKLHESRTMIRYYSTSIFDTNLHFSVSNEQGVKTLNFQFQVCRRCERKALNLASHIRSTNFTFRVHSLVHFAFPIQSTRRYLVKRATMRIFRVFWKSKMQQVIKLIAYHEGL